MVPWTLFIVILLALVGIAGYFLAVLPFTKLIASHRDAETLGKLVSDKKTRPMSLVYHDPESAIEGLDSFSWSVRNVLTPFVGCGPMPGKNHNAYITSMQFRANRELTIPKPKDEYRIFLTGGSTAYSAGAPSDDRTIGGYLNHMLNSNGPQWSKASYEVFTLGNPSWASTHERILIENRISELEPDMVISLSGNNDAHWGMLGRDILWFRSYSDQLFWDLINTAYKKAGYRPMQDIIEIDSSPIDPAVVAKRLEKNIRLSWFSLSLGGAKYLFMLQPTLPVARKVLTDREHKIYVEKWAGTERDFYFLQVYDHMRQGLASLNLRNFYFIDQSGIFDIYNDEVEIFLDSYHFGDRGYEIIAKNIFSAIRPIIEMGSYEGTAGGI